MKMILFSLFTVMCALIFASYRQTDFFNDDDSDISWEEIDDDLWP